MKFKIMAKATILLFVVSGMAMTMAATNATAAEVRVINSKNCYALLSGRIEKGDARKAGAILKNAPWEKRSLCLDSSGGSYIEAVRIMKLLMGQSDDGRYFEHVGTVVDKDMECKFACAIAFLGGSKLLMETIFQGDRTLHESGVLAFGLPPLATGIEGSASREELQASYNEGVEAISELLSLKLRDATDSFIPFQLISGILGLEAGKLMTIQPGRKMESLIVKYIRNDGRCRLYSSNKRAHKTTDCVEIQTY